MAGDDRDDDKGSSTDPDRAAILARRQRFIAMALTGLTATAAGCDDKKPKDPTGEAAGEGKAAEDDGSPHPCLKVEPNQPKPQPCLDVAPEPEPVGDDGQATPAPCLEVAVEPESGSSDGGVGEEPKGPAPKPCLKVKKPDPVEPAPKPCLKVAPVQDPVLDDPPPKPAPKPCLRVKKPT